MSAASVFALLTIGLLLKLVALVLFQGVVRMRSGRFARPEDAAHWKGTCDDHPLARQAQLALRNEGESVPYFLALVASYLALEGDPNIALGLGAVFVVARWCHGATYVWPKQPLRARAFGVGLLAMLCLAGFSIVQIMSQR